MYSSLAAGLRLLPQASLHECVVQTYRITLLCLNFRKASSPELVWELNNFSSVVSDTWEMRASCAHCIAVCALHMLLHHVALGLGVPRVGSHVVHSVSTARTTRAVATGAVPCQGVMEVNFSKLHRTRSADLPSRQLLDSLRTLHFAMGRTKILNLISPLMGAGHHV
jgi:hypothetical protein